MAGSHEPTAARVEDGATVASPAARSNRPILRPAAAWLWMVILLVLTHLPPHSSLIQQWPDYPAADKVVHAGLYAVLGLVVWIGRTPAPQELVMLLVFAALDEWTQTWFGRNPDFTDWLADAVGLTAALGLTRLLRTQARPNSALPAASRVGPSTRVQPTDHSKANWNR